jgi:hypothetical protein
MEEPAFVVYRGDCSFEGLCSFVDRAERFFVPRFNAYSEFLHPLLGGSLSFDRVLVASCSGVVLW